MKIFDAPAIRKADRITIEKQQITSLELMERAAKEVFLWLKANFPDKETLFHVYCGQGNNGGDGLVVARLLKEDNYRVVLDITEHAGKPTDDFKASLEKAKKAGLKHNNKTINGYDKGTLVIIDALFGTGLSREPGQDLKNLINNINKSRAYIVSIDVPSGLFLDRKTHIAVQADRVLTFQLPKLAFYLHDNYPYVKNITVLDIGLDGEFIRNTPTGYYLTERKEVLARYRPIPPYAHKGTQGHALIIAGSYGKMGAACLSAKAALKTGCGLVTAYVPECGYEIMQASFPEAMALTDGEKYISTISFNISPDAIGIGPGLGKAPETAKALHRFLENNKVPLVLDADALNILAENREWLSLLPANALLTPHPKELERLIGSWEDDFEKLEKIKSFSKQYNVIVVAKDARTLIVHGDMVYINSTGNAGLATGGSGDVLTGILTGLLAQSYNPVDAAILGVYIHGLAAEIGTNELSTRSFTASDIISYLGKAFLNIENDSI